MLIFWVHTPFNIKGTNQRFGGTACPYLQFCPEDGGSKFLRNAD